MPSTKHTAIGPDGKPCTLVFQSGTNNTSNLSGHYAKAGLGQWFTGDARRLTPTDDPKVFRLVSDRTKQYTLTD